MEAEAAYGARRVDLDELLGGLLRVLGVELAHGVLDHGSPDGAGRDGVDTHTELAVLDGRVPGEANNPVLRGGVARLVADAADAADGRRVHDKAVALLAHDLEHLLEAEEDAAEVDGDDALELSGAEVLGQVLAALDAGVVEEAVDAAEALERRRDVGVGVGFAGDICCIARQSQDDTLVMS